MAYKDKDKQREANREQMRRARAKGNTNQGNTTKVTQEDWKAVGKDFETVGDDIRKAECSLVNMIEGKPKRGKDITCFADLPPHVQQTIDMMSIVDGKTDNTVKANRTAIAINYQHQFPDRYHSTGV